MTNPKGWYSVEGGTVQDQSGYRVISIDKATGRTAVVQDKLHGKPLTEDQAKRLQDRCCAANDDLDVAYLVEPNL